MNMLLIATSGQRRLVHQSGHFGSDLFQNSLFEHCDNVQIDFSQTPSVEVASDSLFPVTRITNVSVSSFARYPDFNNCAQQVFGSQNGFQRFKKGSFSS